MILNVFMMQFVTSSSSFAVFVSAPPAIWMPKPNRIAATMSGRMALRLNSSVKSGFVKKLTIMSATPSVPPTSPSINSYSPTTGGMSRTVTYMITEAIAAVTRKVAMVTPMILPARLALCMFAIDDEMEQNTVGTAMQNIKFRNTVPSGSSTVAPLSTIIVSPSTTSMTAGQIAPTMQPATMPVSIRIKNP